MYFRVGIIRAALPKTRPHLTIVFDYKTSTMKTHSSILLFIGCLFFFTGYSQEDPGAVKGMIDSKRFVFEAQSMSPMKGGLRTLTPGYTLKVSPDTVASDLPYMGRAYQATMGTSEGGMKFQAFKFEYTVKEKKNSWNVNINTKEVSGSPRVIFTIYDNATARLVISSSTRESITYNGYIRR